MNQTFDPLIALIGNHPEIKKSLEEYDALVKDRVALVGEIQRNQQALAETEQKLTQFQVDFSSRFVISLKPEGKRAKTRKPEPAAEETAEPAEKPARKLTMGQWMASVRLALKANAPLYAETGPAQDEEWWKAQFDAGAKPGEAAAAWASKKAKNGMSDRALSQPDPEGPFYPPSKLGITEQDLDLAISLKLLYPEERQSSEIGIPLNTNQGLFAVVHCNERSSHTVYHLHPVEDAQGKRRIQWPDRLKQYPKLAPEDVPLAGLFVIDEKGHEYIMGPDENRIFVEVPKRKAGKA